MTLDVWMYWRLEFIKPPAERAFPSRFFQVRGLIVSRKVPIPPMTSFRVYAVVADREDSKSCQCCRCYIPLGMALANTFVVLRSHEVVDSSFVPFLAPTSQADVSVFFVPVQAMGSFAPGVVTCLLPTDKGPWTLICVPVRADLDMDITPR